MGVHELDLKEVLCSFNSGTLPHSQLARARRTKKKTTNSQSLILKHYQARCKRVVEDEGVSPIINLKRLHAWITLWLIKLYTKGGECVLDLACGKGGDLMKWEEAGVGYYVGVDMVEGLLEAAKRRYVARGCRFPARFICGDGYGSSLQEAGLRNEGPFDVCSCQFALHYSWSSEQRARAALSNVAALLKPGGFFIGTLPDADMIMKKLKDAVAAAARRGGEGGGGGGCRGGGGALQFGNKLYKVKFDKANGKRALSLPAAGENCFGIQYEFYLADAVNHCPEWLVPLAALRGLAHEYGLELVSAANFHRFLHEHHHNDHHHQQEKLAQHALSLSPLPTTPHNNMQLLLGSAPHSATSPEEWECVSIYLTFAFQKRAVAF